MNVARSAILEAVAGSDPRPSAVLLDIGATADFDVTTADIVRQLIGELHDQSIEVSLAQVKGPVRDRMRRMGLMEMVGEDRVYLSVAAAVEDFRRRTTRGRSGLTAGRRRRTRPSGEPGACPLAAQDEQADDGDPGREHEDDPVPERHHEQQHDAQQVAGPGEPVGERAAAEPDGAPAR